MIREWLNRVLNRSLKTTKFGEQEQEVDWSNIPMTTVPKEFREKINAEADDRVQVLEDKT
jgi:hypothetical protein